MGTDHSEVNKQCNDEKNRQIQQSNSRRINKWQFCEDDNEHNISLN